MRARIVLGAFLVGAWVALWGSVSVANVVTGALVAAAVTAISPNAEPGRASFRLFAVLRFLGVFMVDLVVANAVLAWEVVTPRNRINEGVVAVGIEHVSDFVTLLIANAITLTPGTLTLEVVREPEPVLYVHVLHLRDVEEVRRDVRHLEDLAIAAFGPRKGGSA